MRPSTTVLPVWRWSQTLQRSVKPFSTFWQHVCNGQLLLSCVTQLWQMKHGREEEHDVCSPLKGIQDKSPCACSAWELEGGPEPRVLEHSRQICHSSFTFFHRIFGGFQNQSRTFQATFSRNLQPLLGLSLLLWHFALLRPGFGMFGMFSSTRQYKSIQDTQSMRVDHKRHMQIFENRWASTSTRQEDLLSLSALRTATLWLAESKTARNCHKLP